MSGEIIGTRQDNVPVFAGSETLTFTVSQMPAGIRIYIYVNGIEITEFCGPATADASIGDPIVTDQLGNAAGVVYIPSTAGKYKFPVGEITLTFADAAGGLNNARYLSDAILYNHGASIADLERGSTVALRRTEKLRISNEGSSVDDTNNVRRLDPLAQSFFVDEASHPLGITLIGIVLFFFKKDDIQPVAVEIRPMENGAPSRTEYYSGTYSINLPENVAIVDETTGEAKPTWFPFDYPIFLAPGEYAFCVMTKSDKYEVFTAKLGDGKTVKEPFAGTLFKPQNTGEWVGDTNEDLTFILLRAKFDTTKQAIFEVQTPELPELEYTKLRLMSTEIGFGTTAYANYRIQTTTAGSRVKTPYVDILAQGEPDIQGRQTATEVGDVKVEVTLTTKSEDVAPMLDRQLFKALAMRSMVRPYTEEISNSELKPTGGLATSRYLSRIVALADGYESQGIQVTLDVNRKLGTDIEVYARVLSKDDKSFTDGISGQTWVRLPLVSPVLKTYAGLDDDVFETETYKLLYPGFRYTRPISAAGGGDTLATYEDFTYYQIKIVMYAQNPSIVPKITNMIATSIL